MGCDCYKCIIGTSLASTIIGFAAVLVAVLSNYWISFVSINNYGLIWFCLGGNCKVRPNILEFVDDNVFDFVLVLLMACVLFACLCILFQICLLCRSKNKESMCLATFIVLTSFLAVACGVAALVYGLVEDLKFQNPFDFADQWSMLMAYVGVVFLILSFILTFCLCCVSKAEPHASAYFDNTEIHSNAGTIDNKQQPNNPSYNLPTMPSTPSYPEMQQQMGYYPSSPPQQQQHFQYPMPMNGLVNPHGVQTPHQYPGSVQSEPPPSYYPQY